MKYYNLLSGVSEKCFTETSACEGCLGPEEFYRKVTKCFE